MKLGSLEEMNIRDVWAHEQYGFSKWLSEKDNIDILGKELNLSLTDIETEKFVGNYRCDIICKDELTGKTVLIENQLEPTNHDHLGKIITYASGLGANVIVWIVANARQEHASAIEWLNQNTTDDVAFFLLEIHAYRIGNSEPAPKFEIIEQPNDFAKSVKALVKSATLSETEMKRLEFWNMFNNVIDDRNNPFNKHKATKDNWYTVAVGSSQCHISIDLVNKKHRIRVGLTIDDNKALFDELFLKKEGIEKVLGEPLSWDRLDDKKVSSISLNIKGLYFNKQDNYPELMNSIIDKVLLLKQALIPHLG